MNGLHPDILKDVLQGQWQKSRDAHLENDRTKGLEKKQREPLYECDKMKTSHTTTFTCAFVESTVDTF
jgi:hypothetical protein